MPELDFNTTDFSGNFTMQVVPNGRYKVVIVSSDRKQNNKGTGSFLKLVFEIIECDLKGSQLFNNLNLWNCNATAVKIAREEFTAICLAVNVQNPGCSEQLYNIPMFIDVVCEKRNDGSDKMQNRITAYYSIGQAVAQAPQPTNDVAPYKRSGTGSAPSQQAAWNTPDDGKSF